MRRRIALLLALTAAAVGGLWVFSDQSQSADVQAAPEVVPIQDGKTIDFSSGKAVVGDSVDEKSKLQRSVAEMQAAAGNVSFAPAAKK